MKTLLSRIALASILFCGHIASAGECDDFKAVQQAAKRYFQDWLGSNSTINHAGPNDEIAVKTAPSTFTLPGVEEKSDCTVAIITYRNKKQGEFECEWATTGSHGTPLDRDDRARRESASRRAADMYFQGFAQCFGVSASSSPQYHHYNFTIDGVKYVIAPYLDTMKLTVTFGDEIP